MTHVLIKEGRGRFDTQKGEGDVQLKLEVAVILLPSKEHMGVPEARRGKKGFLLQPSHRVQFCQHLDFRLLASRTVRK